MAVSTIVSLVGFAVAGNISGSIMAIQDKRKNKKEEPIIPMGNLIFNSNSINDLLIEEFINIIEKQILDIMENKKNYTKIFFVKKGIITKKRREKKIHENMRIFEILNFNNLHKKFIKLMIAHNNLSTLNHHLSSKYNWQITSIQNTEIVIEHD